jgi:hypothetical protein
LDLIRVAWAPDPTVAAMWQEALRRAGLAAMIRNHDTAGGLYGAPPVPYSCELLVGAADASAARMILRDLGADADDQEEPG